jgi:hypothetical protein
VEVRHETLRLDAQISVSPFAFFLSFLFLPHLPSIQPVYIKQNIYSITVTPSIYPKSLLRNKTSGCLYRDCYPSYHDCILPAARRRPTSLVQPRPAILQQQVNGDRSSDSLATRKQHPKRPTVGAKTPTFIAYLRRCDSSDHYEQPVLLLLIIWVLCCDHLGN